jgi:hypothetical protein
LIIFLLLSLINRTHIPTFALHSYAGHSSTVSDLGSRISSLNIDDENEARRDDETDLTVQSKMEAEERVR